MVILFGPEVTRNGPGFKEIAKANCSPLPETDVVGMKRERLAVYHFCCQEDFSPSYNIISRGALNIVFTRTGLKNVQLCLRI